MNFPVSKHVDVVAVEVNLKRATLSEADEFKKTLQIQIESGFKKLIVDLNKCEFIDSTFLGAIVVTLKKVTALGGDLKLVGFQPAVQSMFELTRMYRIFEAFPNVDEAVSSYTEK
ncbi:MAG: STAS domain-containing protein [Ignavibacteriaceae bacterium]|nr:STAS domain-containing protein [Ignavibacteriaceae bacterium]